MGVFCLCLGAENKKNSFLIGNEKERDSYLSDFFDLGASFANQRATLAPWENQAKCHRWLACHVAVCHCCANVLGENSKICFLAPTVRMSALFDKSVFGETEGKVLGVSFRLQSKSFYNSHVERHSCIYNRSKFECFSLPLQTSVRSWRKL